MPRVELAAEFLIKHKSIIDRELDSDYRDFDFIVDHIETFVAIAEFYDAPEVEQFNLGVIMNQMIKAERNNIYGFFDTDFITNVMASMEKLIEEDNVHAWDNIQSTFFVDALNEKFETRQVTTKDLVSEALLRDEEKAQGERDAEMEINRRLHCVLCESDQHETDQCYHVKLTDDQRRRMMMFNREPITPPIKPPSNDTYFDKVIPGPRTDLDKTPEDVSFIKKAEFRLKRNLPLPFSMVPPLLRFVNAVLPSFVTYVPRKLLTTVVTAVESALQPEVKTTLHYSSMKKYNIETEEDTRNVGSQRTKRLIDDPLAVEIKVTHEINIPFLNDNGHVELDEFIPPGERLVLIPQEDIEDKVIHEDPEDTSEDSGITYTHRLNIDAFKMVEYINFDKSEDDDGKEGLWETMWSGQTTFGDRVTAVKNTISGGIKKTGQAIQVARDLKHDGMMLYRMSYNGLLDVKDFITVGPYYVAMATEAYSSRIKPGCHHILAKSMEYVFDYTYEESMTDSFLKNRSLLFNMAMFNTLMTPTHMVRDSTDSVAWERITNALKTMHPINYNSYTEFQKRAWMNSGYMAYLHLQGIKYNDSDLPLPKKDFQIQL